MNFKQGQLVILRSGGPVMTVVDDTYNHGYITRCMWFINGVLFERDFEPAALRLLQEEKKDN